MSVMLPKRVLDQVYRAEELRKGRRRRTVLIPYKVSEVERQHAIATADMLHRWLKQRG